MARSVRARRPRTMGVSPSPPALHPGPAVRDSPCRPGTVRAGVSPSPCQWPDRRRARPDTVHR